MGCGGCYQDMTTSASVFPEQRVIYSEQSDFFLGGGGGGV